MKQYLLIDKENNANHINLNLRKIKRGKEGNRPGTSSLLETFNPLPRINKGSIPVLSREKTNSYNQEDALSEF